MFFAFGVAFEVPVAVVLLVLTGIVQVEKLGENRGYVIIGIFVLAAFLTPPDAISQMHHGRPDVAALRGRPGHGTHHAEDAPRGGRGREKEEAEAR